AARPRYCATGGSASCTIQRADWKVARSGTLLAGGAGVSAWTPEAAPATAAGMATANAAVTAQMTAPAIPRRTAPFAIEPPEAELPDCCDWRWWCQGAPAGGRYNEGADGARA